MAVILMRPRWWKLQGAVELVDRAVAPSVVVASRLVRATAAASNAPW
jgi:hypothetical protein